MKIIGIIAVVLVGSGLVMANPIQPQTLNSAKLYRDEVSITYVTNIHFTQSATLLVTNCTLYSSADLGTNSTIQGLSNITVEVATSSSSTSTGTWSTATVQIATNGTWWIRLADIPAASTIYWQCRITDATTNVYYYQQKMLYADPHL